MVYLDVLEEDALQRKFTELKDEWHRGTHFTSSTTDLVLHPAYQRIIGLGPAVVPLLLREMATEPDHWHWALVAITGENPVPEHARGNVYELAAAWTAWANAQMEKKPDGGAP